MFVGFISVTWFKFFLILFISNSKIIATILVYLPRASRHSGDFLYILSKAHHSSDKADINVPVLQTEMPREEISGKGSQIWHIIPRLTFLYYGGKGKFIQSCNFKKIYAYYFLVTNQMLKYCRKNKFLRDYLNKYLSSSFNEHIVC